MVARCTQATIFPSAGAPSRCRPGGQAEGGGRRPPPERRPQGATLGPGCRNGPEKPEGCQIMSRGQPHITAVTGTRVYQPWPPLGHRLATAWPPLGHRLATIAEGLCEGQDGRLATSSAKEVLLAVCTSIARPRPDA
eukprot:SAG22_NODE_4_length_44774_cov_362.122149_51_plen_137_part_00